MRYERRLHLLLEFGSIIAMDSEAVDWFDRYKFKWHEKRKVTIQIPFPYAIDYWWRLSCYWAISLTSQSNTPMPTLLFIYSTQLLVHVRLNALYSGQKKRGTKATLVKFIYFIHSLSKASGYQMMHFCAILEKSLGKLSILLFYRKYSGHERCRYVSYRYGRKIVLITRNVFICAALHRNDRIGSLSWEANVAVEWSTQYTSIWLFDRQGTTDKEIPITFRISWLTQDHYHHQSSIPSVCEPYASTYVLSDESNMTS